MSLGNKHMFTDEEIEDVIRKAENGVPRSTLRAEYHCGFSTIERILKEHNVQYVNIDKHHNIPSCNIHYFDSIDTPNKAYFLGFLFADGRNVYKKDEIKIQLQECDLHILESFKKEIESILPIKINRQAISNGEIRNYYILRMCGKHLCDRLNELGMTPNKSATISLPKEGEVPHEYFRDFLRGYVDGNGSISWCSKRYCISITSSKFSVGNFKSIYLMS